MKPANAAGDTGRRDFLRAIGLGTAAVGASSLITACASGGLAARTEGAAPAAGPRHDAAPPPVMRGGFPGVAAGPVPVPAVPPRARRERWRTPRVAGSAHAQGPTPAAGARPPRWTARFRWPPTGEPV